MRFNVRVYAIILNDEGEVLLSHERRFGTSFSKFPGGGVEWGEGLKDALKRELMEELGLEAEIGELRYVNDFFQQSAFREADQIISFYFSVDSIDIQAIDLRNFEQKNELEGETFKWEVIRPELMDILTFPIDQKMASILIDKG